MNEDKPFTENLDELIAIFGQIRERAVGGMFGNIDVSFLADFDALVANYCTIKQNAASSVLETVSQPLRELVNLMIEQIKTEIDAVNSGCGAATAAQSANAIDQGLDYINSQLKSDNLSIQEIDELLDERKRLLKQKESI
jgi:uncharacterized protein YfkK (UPF0435 family)